MVVDTVVLRFPGFKEKAVTLSYDDDVVASVRLKEILDKYGLKCTFNFNGGLFTEKTTNRKLCEEDAVKFFAGSNHEIACHGYRHYTLTQTEPQTGAWDILKDRCSLERIFKRIIYGYAYPNGGFARKAAETARTAGIKYARTVKSTHDFRLPVDWLEWNPTCRHADPQLFDLLEDFLRFQRGVPNDYDSRVFYLWGHAYEFDDDDNWEIIEKFAKIVADNSDVIYCATNGEIYRYAESFRLLEFDLERKIIYNPTQVDLYIQINKTRNYVLKAGETLYVE